MNFQEMNKEQKQQLILGILIVCTVVFLGQNAVLRPAKEKLALAKTETKDLSPKVTMGETILSRDLRNKREVTDLAGKIDRIQSAHLPPAEGRFIWALQQISNVGHSLDLNVKVAETNRDRYRKSNGKTFAETKNNVPMWIPYAVDVSFSATFHQTTEFLRRLQASNPYISVGQLGIYAAEPDENPELQTISIVVEWPVFRDNRDLVDLQKLAKGGTS